MTFDEKFYVISVNSYIKNTPNSFCRMFLKNLKNEDGSIKDHITDLNENLVATSRQLTRILKSEPETKLIPIIALSAHAMQEHKDKALEAGCDDYDTKPVDIKRLLEKISKFLDT